jgi:hypothetical protein
MKLCLSTVVFVILTFRSIIASSETTTVQGQDKMLAKPSLHQRLLMQAMQEEIEQCSDEIKTLIICGIEAVDCLGCWNTALIKSSTSVETCNEIEQTACPTFQASCQDICDSSCYDEVFAAVNCYLNTTVDCTVDCGAITAGTTEGKSFVGSISIAVIMAFTTLLLGVSFVI